jgi:hypothetical protein
MLPYRVQARSYNGLRHLPDLENDLEFEQAEGVPNIVKMPNSIFMKPHQDKSYLIEKKIGEALGTLFPGRTFVHNKSVPKSESRARPDYRCDELMLIVEFDGYQHYSQTKTILADEEKDSLYSALGYSIVRIPYFVQLSSTVIELLFSLPAVTWEQVYPHGFIADEALLPADFCPLGVCRFERDLARFACIRPEILASLNAKIEELGDSRRVVPPAFKF